MENEYVFYNIRADEIKIVCAFEAFVILDMSDIYLRHGSLPPNIYLGEL